jgi:hypothetical protein
VNWTELEAWTAEVTSRGLLAELFVIDEELDVTMYRLGYAEIAGNQATWATLSSEQIDALRTGWSSRIARGEGWYIPSDREWPWACHWRRTPFRAAPSEMRKGCGFLQTRRNFHAESPRPL